MPGAFHCPRGMLEFWIDPASPYHKPQFAQDKRFVFFCAGGLRSALAAQAAQRMGLKPVAHIRGGFGAWKNAGGPVEAPSRQSRSPDAAMSNVEQPGPEPPHRRRRHYLRRGIGCLLKRGRSACSASSGLIGFIATFALILFRSPDAQGPRALTPRK